MKNSVNAHNNLRPVQVTLRIFLLKL